MRISATKVVQLVPTHCPPGVESEPPQVVIVDTSTGDEVALTPLEVNNLIGALNYFHPFIKKDVPMCCEPANGWVKDED